jgi:hypothetical protein
VSECVCCCVDERAEALVSVVMQSVVEVRALRSWGLPMNRALIQCWPLVALDKQAIQMTQRSSGNE